MTAKQRRNFASVKEQVINKFKSLGYKIDRQGFGIIDIGEKQIIESFKYLQTEEERAAFFTVLGVLKHGIEIHNRNNHKGRSYNTVTFAAPVEINGQKGIQAVVVKRTKGNRYKTHRIINPDGSVFTFSDTKTEATLDRMTSVSEGESLPITSVINSISQNNENVKHSVDTNAESEERLTPTRVARRLINDYGAKGNVYENDVTDALKNLAAEAQSVYSDPDNIETRYKAFEKHVYDLANRIADGARRVDNYAADLYKEIYKDVSDTIIHVTDNFVGDIPEYNDFRKSNFGSLKLSRKQGEAIDTFYQELAEKYPGVFDAREHIAESDMLYDILNKLEGLRTKEYEYSASEREALTESIKDEIINASLNLMTPVEMTNNTEQRQTNTESEDAPPAPNEEDNKKVSKLYENTMQKEMFTDDFKNEAESRIDEFMYEGISNKETYETAKAALEQNGADATAAELATKSGQWTADDTAAALALMAKYQTEGDVKKAVDIAAVLREKMTKAGQAVQALKIVNKLTPEGQFIDFTRQADNMVEEQIEKHPAKDKIRKELKDAEQKDRAKKNGENGTSGAPSPTEAEQGNTTQPKQQRNNTQRTAEKSERDKVLDKWNIEHLSDEDMTQVNDMLKTLDTLDDKDSLIDLILKQSRERKTAAHGAVKNVYDDPRLNDMGVVQMMAEDFENAHPEFKQAADNLYEWQRKLMKTWLVDTGVITQEQYDTFTQMYPDYVPFFREQDTTLGRGKVGMANQGEVIKEAVGSESRRILEPIENIMYNVASYVNHGTKHEVIKTAVQQYDMLDSDPENNVLRQYWEEVVPVNPEQEQNLYFRPKRGDDPSVDDATNEGETKHGHMKHGEEKAVMKSDAGEIMPCYKTYCDTKKKYRRYEVTEQPLEMATNDLCCDMKKFILSLMSNADTTEEKNKVKEMIVQLHEMFQKGV